MAITKSNLYPRSPKGLGKLREVMRASGSTTLDCGDTEEESMVDESATKGSDIIHRKGKFLFGKSQFEPEHSIMQVFWSKVVPYFFNAHTGYCMVYCRSPLFDVVAEGTEVPGYTISIGDDTISFAGHTFSIPSTTNLPVASGKAYFYEPNTTTDKKVHSTKVNAIEDVLPKQCTEAIRPPLKLINYLGRLGQKREGAVCIKGSLLNIEYEKHKSIKALQSEKETKPSVSDITKEFCR